MVQDLKKVSYRRTTNWHTRIIEWCLVRSSRLFAKLGSEPPSLLPFKLIAVDLSAGAGCELNGNHGHSRKHFWRLEKRSFHAPGL